MKKFTLMFALIAMTVLGAHAQVFEQGSGNLNFGIGFGSPFIFASSKSTLPPISASYEYGVTEKIGVGGLIGYTASSYEFQTLNLDPNSSSLYTNIKTTYSYLIIGARGNYHFVNKDKIDVYAGAMLGYNVASAKTKETPDDPFYNYDTGSIGGFAIGGHLGLRYMFSDKIGAFTEVGYNVGYFNLGVTVKM
jgi:hypothetical protein